MRQFFTKTKGIRLGLVAVLVVSTFVIGMLPHPVIEQNDADRSWHVVWEGSLADYARAAEANPGDGVSGILSVYIYPHDASPGTEYAENTSATLEAACLGYANADALRIDVPHSTAFDIVVRVRGNKTHCWVSDQFYDSYLRVRITAADLSIGADTLATGVISYNNTGKDFIWMNHYLNAGGAGYSLIRDQTAEITHIKFEAYY